MPKITEWIVSFREDKLGIRISKNCIDVQGGGTCFRGNKTEEEFMKSIEGVIADHKHLIELYGLAIVKYTKEFIQKNK